MVTNYIKGASYKEIYDIHTDSQDTSLMTIHTPISKIPRKMLAGFFTQYRRFKYSGCTVRLQPAARLPADPLQVSYEEGEPTIDPRDMLNPILCRGYCGDSLGYFLNSVLAPGQQGRWYQESTGASYEEKDSDGFVGNSLDKTSFPEVGINADTRSSYLERLYYESLGDPGFRKIPMQRGFKKRFYPLVYELATTTQRLAHDTHPEGLANQSIMNPVGQGTPGELSDTVQGLQDSGPQQNKGVSGSYQSSNLPSATNVFPEDAGLFQDESAMPLGFYVERAGSTTSPVNRVFTYRRTVPVLTSSKRRLGWLDTDSTVVRTPMISSSVTSASTGATLASLSGSANLGSDPMSSFTSYLTDRFTEGTCLPMINMGLLILPKAYKTEMYYRLTITHHFQFKDFRPAYGLISPYSTDYQYGPVLEWADWDDDLTTTASVSSTKANVALTDVVPDVSVWE